MNLILGKLQQGNGRKMEFLVKCLSNGKYIRYTKGWMYVNRDIGFGDK